MAKKAAKKASRKKKKAASPIKDRAHKVWLAGLGALAVAESEGGKLFNQLVDKGAELEKRGKPVVDKLVKQASEKAADVRKKAGARAGKVGDEAKAGWTKVESAVDETVSSALQRMGIPTRKEIEALSRRVEALTAKLDGKPTRRKAAKKTTKKAAKKAAKSTARKAPAKRAAKAAPRSAPEPAKQAAPAGPTSLAQS